MYLFLLLVFIILCIEVKLLGILFFSFYAPLLVVIIQSLGASIILEYNFFGGTAFIKSSKVISSVAWCSSWKEPAKMLDRYLTSNNRGKKWLTYIGVYDQKGTSIAHSRNWNTYLPIGSFCGFARLDIGVLKTCENHCEKLEKINGNLTM